MNHKHTYIIAEAGVNHNGDPDKAMQLVDVAIEAGVDAVKFQVFSADRLATRSAGKAEYQRRATGDMESQYEMLKRLELDHGVYKKLATYCAKKNIEFLSSAFDSESLDFLVLELKLQALKVASGELTNGPFLLQHALTKNKLLLSTGMSTLSEIEEALGVIAFGFTAPGVAKPSRDTCREIYYSEKGQQALREKVVLLHCTTEYPAPAADINLKAINTLSAAFRLPVGYSDHSEGIIIPVAAVACGAVVIEKHFTLDKNLPGPDHQASLEPHELKEMVNAIRFVETAMGDGVKIPRPSELKNRAIARKSLIAARDIRAGEVFTEENISIKRPGSGLSPMDYWNLLGKTASVNIKAGTPICD